MSKYHQAIPPLILAVTLLACVLPSPADLSSTPRPSTAADRVTVTWTSTPPGTAVATATATTSPEHISLEKEMFTAVNRKRRLRGLAPYRLDETLAALARGHAQDMAMRGYMGHVTPEGVTYRDRLAKAGLNPYWAGESWHYGLHPPKEAVDMALRWFMDSALHRNNIFHAQYTRIGVGVASGPEGGHFIVLTFAGEE